MVNSPVAEGKLHLRSFLNGPGSALRRAMVRSGQVSDARVVGLLAELPSLEIYLPVPAHRDLWNGGENLIVAVSRGEEQAPIGVTLDGQPVTLTLDEPPATPVLVLGPAESFDGQGEAHSWSRRPSVVRKNPAGTGIGTLDHCEPDTETCDHDGGGVPGDRWLPPDDAVFQRGEGIREIASHLRTPNDHEPWTNGAPEFRLFIAGTSDTDGAAELMNKINVPEGGWSGSDDDNNSKWREFDPLILVDWGTNYGTYVAVKCMEEDFDWSGIINVTANGSTTIGGQGVNFSGTWNQTINGSSDNCGEHALLVRTSSGVWTRIPDARDRGDASPDYDGTSDFHWVGYGRSIL